MPGGVSRCVQHTKSPRGFDDLTIGEGVCDRSGGEATTGEPPEECPESRGRISWRGDAVADEGRVIGVNLYASDAGRFDHVGGAPGMVTVRVGENDPLDIPRVFAQVCQAFDDGPGRAFDSAVDERDGSVVLHESERIDEVAHRRDSIDAGR